MSYDSDDEFRTVFSARQSKPAPINQSIKLTRSLSVNQTEIASQIERELAAFEQTYQSIDRLLKAKTQSNRSTRMIEGFRHQAINQSRRIHSLFQSHATLISHQKSTNQSFSQSISLSINQSRASLLESFMLYYQQYAACTDLIVQALIQCQSLNRSTSQPANQSRRTASHSMNQTIKQSNTQRRSLAADDDDDDESADQPAGQSDVDKLQLMVREVGLTMKNEQVAYNQSVNESVNRRLSQSTPSPTPHSTTQSISDLYHQSINRAIGFTLTGAGLGALIGGPIGGLIGAKSASGLGLASALASGVSGLLIGGLTGTVASIITEPANLPVAQPVSRTTSQPPTPLVRPLVRGSVNQIHQPDDFDGPSRRRTQPVFSSLSVSPRRAVKQDETRNEWRRME